MALASTHALGSGRGRAVLVAGLWSYADVDEKKSLGRLNAVHNDENRHELLSLVGVQSIDGLGYEHDGVVRPLFKSSVETEPTLVTVALRGLIPATFDVTEVPLIDLLESTTAPNSAIDELLARADVCLLSTSYVTNFRDLDHVIDLLKRRGGGVIVGGGYLCTRNAEECLRRGIDIVVIGDAEEALPRLLQCVGEPRSWASVPNLAYLDPNGAPIFTATVMTNLDEIPVAVPGGDLSGMAVPYESMRGCPYRCGFCSYPLVSTKWRYKSANKLISDFRAIEERGAHNIIALDSTFTIPPTRLVEFLRLYIEAGLRIPWGAYSRVTALKSKAIVNDLKRANNRWLSVGFETGSDRILKIMNKGTTMRDAHVALDHLKEYQISPWSNFIVGYPGETRATVAETVSFMKERIFGFYGIYVFNIRDRAMPVLSDAYADVHYEGIGGEWTHVTMDSRTATQLRWSAYLEVAVSNMCAINIDVFRGTNVEKEYGAWSPAFPALKNIELFTLAKACRDDPASISLDPDDIRQRVRRTVIPL